MNEFLKLNWRSIRINTLLEDIERNSFISEESIRNSYVFRGLPSTSNQLKDNDKDDFEQKFIPGKQYFCQGGKNSRLNKSQQYRCMRALKILQEKTDKKLDLFEEDCLKLYSSLRPVILEENKLFVEHVKKQWKPRRIKRNKYFNFISNLWKQKLLFSLKYKQFYKEVISLPFSYSKEETSVEVVHLKNLLELGSVAKFSRPTLQSKFILEKKSSDDDSNLTFYSKLPISQDKNVFSLLKNELFDLVISSSALKKIMEYTDLNGIFDIPVIIKTVQGKKVVFVDKALPRKHPTIRNLNEKLYKILIKENLCQFEGLKYINSETLISHPDLYDLNTEVENEIKCEKNNKAEGTKESLSEKQNLSHHNVSYRLWSFKSKNPDVVSNSNKELKILVRCKLDACEEVENGKLHPVVVVPKLEYQLGYGGEEPTKTELTNLWTYLFFRPFSVCYRIRLHPVSGEVVVVEEVSLQKINIEAMNFHQIKPYLGLDVFYKICKELISQEVGNYLLRHTLKDGPFISLMKVANEGLPGVYDLHEDYEKNCKVSLQQPWRPIDVNYIMPMHDVYKRLPGTFIATTETKKNNQKSKGKVTKKKKKKGKAKK